MNSGESKNSGTMLSAARLKAEALRLGFSCCGLAPAAPVPDTCMARYETWLHEGRHGDMHYLENHLSLRRDPRLLLPEAKTVVSLAMSYNPGTLPTQPALAWYAQGKDYHEVVRAQAKALIHALYGSSLPDGVSYRICVDTAPILEKYWAWRCGLGWIGHHTQLVIPHVGSAFFLAEILLTQAADHYDEPLPRTPNGECGEGCASCHRCLDACPTKAITEQGMDARLCLSYLTIEYRGDFAALSQNLPELPQKATQLLQKAAQPPQNSPQSSAISCPASTKLSSLLGTCFYGCDRCLRVCPHLSRQASPITEFRPSPQLLAMTTDDWLHLSRECYLSLFRSSAVKRAKYEGLLRNISVCWKQK